MSAAFRRAQHAANRDVTGQGSQSKGVTAYLTRRLSTRSLASRAFPRPARLEHLMSRSRRGAVWSFPSHAAPVTGRRTDLAKAKTAVKRFRPGGTPFPASSRRAHGLDGLSGVPLWRPREEPPHGVCPEVLSVVDGPKRGRPNPQPVPRLWIVAGAFSIRRDSAL
jgi:hypothetical protein